MYAETLLKPRGVLGTFFRYCYAHKNRKSLLYCVGTDSFDHELIFRSFFTAEVYQSSHYFSVSCSKQKNFSPLTGLMGVFPGFNFNSIHMGGVEISYLELRS